MEFLDIPLRLESGSFHRAAPEEALSRYVNLFFCTRKYAALPALDFGTDPDRLAWISADDYLRVLVDEFNRVHRNQLALRVEGQESHAGTAHALLTLRFGRNNYRIRMAMGSLLQA